MIASATSLFLVCSSNSEFSRKVAELLDETVLRWAPLNASVPLAADTCAAVLLDVEDAELTNLVIGVRRESTWNDLPLIILGGEPRRDLAAERSVTLVDFPKDSQVFEWILRRHASPRVPLPVADGAEDRRTYRYRSGQNCVVEVDLKLVDLSEGGAQLESSVPFDQGSIVRLNMANLDSELSLTLSLEILRVHCLGEDGNRFRLHGRFVEVSPSQRRALGKLLLKMQISVAQQARAITHI